MQEPKLEELIPKKVFEKPRAPLGMRNFTMCRLADQSGVSGAGIVIQGTVYANGEAAVQWVTGPEAGSIQVRPWEKFLDTHVRSHPTNRTIITWEDSTQDRYEPETTRETK
jgi:hypothetical protein